jgi:hypothetical protein
VLADQHRQARINRGLKRLTGVILASNFTPKTNSADYHNIQGYVKIEKSIILPG